MDGLVGGFWLWQCGWFLPGTSVYGDISTFRIPIVKLIPRPDLSIPWPKLAENLQSF